MNKKLLYTQARKFYACEVFKCFQIKLRPNENLKILKPLSEKRNTDGNKNELKANIWFPQMTVDILLLLLK